MRNHQAVIDDCTAALARQPNYVKALMRLSAAQEALDRPQEAHASMKKAQDHVAAVGSAALLGSGGGGGSGAPPTLRGARKRGVV